MADTIDFKEMISYMRPEGSVHQRKFNNRYLRPVFGQPDAHGNYIKIVGDNPRIAFMSHHDTVHLKSGRSEVVLRNGFYTVDNGPEGNAPIVIGKPFTMAKYNCLGADCTTGVYIMLRMIEAGVPGVYVVHAGEEIGCVGSRALVADHPNWIDHVDIAISFDRKGYSSVITHQMGMRTCSDAFADSFADMMDMGFEKDTGGSYTDSNEYVSVVRECTNISVGYFNQHSRSESQDKVFLEMLVEKLIAADWDKLVVARKCDDFEDLYEKDRSFSTFGARGWETNMRDWDYDDDAENDIDAEAPTLSYMVDIVKENPKAIAKLLQDLGYDAYDLYDEVQDYDAEIKVSRGFRKK